MSRRSTARGALPSRRRFLAGLLAALPAVPACRDPGLYLWGPPPPAAGAFEVEHARDVAYYHGPDATERHRLDVYLPRGRTDCPVVLLVHGGAWMLGDKHSWGLYASVGEFLARQGVVAVLPNYRLSPAVRHPEHVKDVARAFAWTHAEAAGLGGSPGRIVLVGHSAGGHLVSLLATHPGYLRAHRLGPSAIRGVVAVSGVYRIPVGPMDVRLGGPTPDAFRTDQVLPLRAACPRACWLRSPLPGIPLHIDVYGPAFGDDPRVRRDASPIEHVRPGLPPFLLCTAEDDLPSLPEMARDFHQALTDQGVAAQLRCFEGRNHSSVFLNAVAGADPLAAALLDFVRRHAG